MKNKKNISPITTVLIFTATITLVFFWFILDRGKTLDSIATEVIEPTPTTIEINKSIKIQILNATKIDGQADTVKEMLANLGFTDITLSNAKPKVTKNFIHLKPTVTFASSYFQSRLYSQFPAAYTIDLKETETYDAVFIIGTDLKTGDVESASTIITPVPTLYQGGYGY